MNIKKVTDRLIVENGIWSDVEGKKFRIIKVIEIDEQIWIYYASKGKEPYQEYSCYLESFLERFKEEPK